MGDLAFNEWFTIFLDEKGLSDTLIEFDDTQNHSWVQMPIQVIQEFLSYCSEDIQQKFKSKVVKLDFCNMNLSTFLEYIARSIEKMRED